MNKSAILRLDYTKRPQGFRPSSQAEWFDVSPNVCPCCTTTINSLRIEKDIVGGKYLAYVIHPCDCCGWWTAFKFWEDRTGETIYAMHRLEPKLEEFNIADRAISIDKILRLLKRDFRLLRDVHWKVFEQLVQRFLSEQGYHTVDVSRSRGSGGDILLFRLDGKSVLVEVKHWKYDPVSVDVVDRLHRVIQRKGYDAGLIVTSNRFTKDALEVLEKGALAPALSENDEKIVSGVDFGDIMEWLRLIELRQASQVVEQLKYFIDDNAMSEM